MTYLETVKVFALPIRVTLHEYFSFVVDRKLLRIFSFQLVSEISVLALWRKNFINIYPKSEWRLNAWMISHYLFNELYM